MPTRRGLRSWWMRMKKALGLEGDADFVFHTCRHTCATRMVDAGVNVFVIRDWLGHTRIETTLRYAHVHPKNIEDALDRVGDFMRATGADHRISAAVPTVRPYPTGGGNGVYPWAMRGVADGKSRGSSCGRGEIGRRSGLKIRFPFGSAGSSPAVRTRRTCCLLLSYVGLETGRRFGAAPG